MFGLMLPNGFLSIEFFLFFIFYFFIFLFYFLYQLCLIFFCIGILLEFLSFGISV